MTWQGLAAKKRIVIIIGLMLAIGVALMIGIVWRQADTPKQTVPRQAEASHAKPEQNNKQPQAEQLFPNNRFVALYGAPQAPVLGVLGEQPLAETIERSKQLAAAYQPLVKEKVVPTLEIITTIASSTPTENGDFSRETPINTLLPWIEQARKAGVYVVLDLQPGYSTFLDQAKAYRQLLEQPNVGLALDPEWRLKPGQRHMEQIGSVNIGEVNQTAQWLADLTAQHKLPQKLFLLHQFRMSMLEDRQQLDTGSQHLAYVIQMDGNGGQTTKLDTWRVIQQELPQNVHLGWKNFYDEDRPMLTPAETMTVSPVPWYVSYQ